MAITAIAATWYIEDEDGYPGPNHETLMVMGPGQDVLADAPKIISILLWSDNRRANEIKIIALRISDVNP